MFYKFGQMIGTAPFAVVGGWSDRGLDSHCPGGGGGGATATVFTLVGSSVPEGGAHRDSGSNRLGLVSVYGDVARKA